MKNSLRAVFTILLFSFIYNTSLAQNENININIEEANQILRLNNLNILNALSYQEDLKIWLENKNRQENQIPKYKKATHLRINKLPNSSTVNSSNDLFNHRYHFLRLQNKIEAQEKLLSNLEQLSNTYSNEELLIEECFSIISKLQENAEKLAEICYDFSRACAVNYKTGVYPKELNKVKQVVSQSKNVILAFRDRDEILIREYTSLLNDALNTMKNTTKVDLIHQLSKIDMPLEQLYKEIITIYNKGFEIASWSDLYLQSNFTKEESIPYIQQAVLAFNGEDLNGSCAGTFNKLISIAEIEHIHFLLEPISLAPSEIVLEKPEKEVFEKNNRNSLAGALPNNLIMLLDVSASMKTSGKIDALKKSISHFLNIMRIQDKISLISYSGESSVLQSGASKYDKQAILDTLEKIKSGGGTDIMNALKAAKKVAKENFITQGNNKVIIASDGAFGVSKNAMALVQQMRSQNISISIFHYCKANEDNNIATLKKLAIEGNGKYIVIKNDNEAINAILEELKIEALEKN